MGPAIGADSFDAPTGDCRRVADGAAYSRIILGSDVAVDRLRRNDGLERECGSPLAPVGPAERVAANAPVVPATAWASEAVATWESAPPDYVPVPRSPIETAFLVIAEVS